jgi:hypothetical protein
MKKFISALAFIVCTAPAAFAQIAGATGSVSTGGPYTMPTKRPADAKTPKGVFMASLKTEATCGSNIKINVTLNYFNMTTPTKVLLWGNFPNTYASIPAGSGTVTSSIVGNKLTCTKKPEDYGLLNIYAALGDTQAMATKSFSALGIISTIPLDKAVLAERATPKGVTLKSMEVRARCNGGTELSVGVEHDTTAGASLFLDLPANFIGTAEPDTGLVLDPHSLPVGSGKGTDFFGFINNQATNMLHCDGSNINFQTALSARVFFGNTLQASTSNLATGRIDTIYGSGEAADLIP